MAASAYTPTSYQALLERRYSKLDRGSPLGPLWVACPRKPHACVDFGDAIVAVRLQSSRMCSTGVTGSRGLRRAFCVTETLSGRTCIIGIEFIHAPGGVTAPAIKPPPT